MKNLSPAAAALAVLVGCAQPYALPPIPPDHPANAGAAETSSPPPSVAFEAGIPARMPEGEPSDGHGGHGAHGGQGGQR